MKLQQLRYIWEVAHNKLNVSSTAQILFTSQPGISKQIRLLEDELGVEIFSRSGKHLTHITSAGYQVINIAGEILKQVNNIKCFAQEQNNKKSGRLTLSLIHSPVRYYLPKILKKFSKRYPNVIVNIHDVQSQDIDKLVINGSVDFGLTTEKNCSSKQLLMYPCLKWNKCILMHKQHPLSKKNKISLEDIAKYSIISYVPGDSSSKIVIEAFSNAGIVPKIDITSQNTDIIEKYVADKFGVGIVDSIAVNMDNLTDIVARDVGDLFKPTCCFFVIRKGTYLREFVYEFAHIISPNLTKERLEKILLIRNKLEIEELYSNLDIPDIKI